MCQCSAEMNPVDGPWIVVIGGIGMWGMGWHDEVLVGFHLILLTIDAVMSAAFHAIDQYALVDGFRSLPIMIGGVRIVAYVRDMQGPQYRVGFSQIQNHLRHNQ